MIKEALSYSGERNLGRRVHGRIHILDPLRGIAAFAVMWFHFTREGVLLQTTSTIESFIIASGDLGLHGVDVFFVISGLVLPYSMHAGRYRLRAFSTFLKKRLLRLEPPYLFTIVLTLALWYLTVQAANFVSGGAGNEFSLDMTRLLLHLGYLNAFFGYEWYNDVFWTLAIEFQFYLIIAVLYPLVVSSRRALHLSVPIVLAATAWLIGSESLVFRYLPLFSLGITTAQYFLGLYSGRYFIGTLVLISIPMFDVLSWYRALFGLTAISIIIASVQLSDRDIRIPSEISRSLTWLGTISYSLYLIHIPIGNRIIQVLANFDNPWFVSIGVIFGATTASLVASYLMHRVIEQPSQRLSSNIKYKK